MIARKQFYDSKELCDFVPLCFLYLYCWLLEIFCVLREPLELVNPPFAIVRDIPIPVYGEDEYRAVSLRQILSKMGPSERSHNGGLMKTLGDYYDVTIESKIGKV